MKILISRTDGIGDVILTLPLCGWIKQNIPSSEVHFLCQYPTKDIAGSSAYIDHVHVWNGSLPKVDTIIHVFPKKKIAREAKRVKIKKRIGTSHRLFHLTNCNKLIRFSRNKSDLHESQLNFKLLKGLGINVTPELSAMMRLTGWNASEDFRFPFISKDKLNVIFHIKSRGSAKEWRADHFFQLAQHLPKENFNIFLTGTKNEGDIIHREIPGILELENVKDTTGQLSLKQLISLIGQCQCMVACSTGPLHISGVSNIHCIGLFPQKRPMHLGRWKPLGGKVVGVEEGSEKEADYLNIPLDKILKEVLKIGKV